MPDTRHNKITRTPLPIDAALPQLGEALSQPGITILQAPPGAGKTTRVPLFLLEQASWLNGKRIIMLEPRRLAARGAATHMAGLLNEPVGQRVGYQVRLERKISRKTRIEIVTEGLLTRKLQDDPALEKYGIVIFDEIHERSLDAELALALCRDAQSALRQDLRILLMSATLETDSLATELNAHVVTTEGRCFPVQTEFDPVVDRRDVPRASATAALHSLRHCDGDLLLFLPGFAEIRRTQEQLRERGVPKDVDLHLLHGGIPLREQQQAIGPAPPGRRKVVLATAIAETSLTIEGVRVVIDCGWMRVPRFSARTGMTRLETVRVTRDAADQRRGRAGRTAPGHCIRLWSEAEDARLLPARVPEIETADLAPLVLQLALWGVTDPQGLRWLTPPPDAAFSSAQSLLRMLQALDMTGALTPLGHQLTGMPMHPRLARMLYVGREAGWESDAALLAAMLSERDPMPIGHGRGCDVAMRLDMLQNGSGTIRHNVRERIFRLAQSWQRHATDQQPACDPGELLAAAFPDRIGRRRGADGRYLLANGRGAELDPDDPLSGSEWIVAAQLNDRGTSARVMLGCAISAATVESLSESATISRVVEWDEQKQRVTASERLVLGAIVLRERPLRDVSPEETASALLQALCDRDLEPLPWGKEAQQWCARVDLLHRELPQDDWPDTSRKGLAASAEQWLLPALMPLRALSDVKRIDLITALRSLLDYKQQRDLDKLAPERLPVPSGSRIRLDYESGEIPVLAVRIQELFGMTETPRIAHGRVAVLIHLLSPARRPVQITQDLAGFWARGYAEARKELRGRYPKHNWPEDPAEGIASRYTTRRRK